MAAVIRDRAAGYGFLDAPQVLFGGRCVCRGGGTGHSEENVAERASAFVRRVTHSDTFSARTRRIRPRASAPPGGVIVWPPLALLLETDRSGHNFVYVSVFEDAGQLAGPRPPRRDGNVLGRVVGRGPVHEVLLVGSGNAERLVLGGAFLAGFVRIIGVVLLFVEALDGEPPVS